MKLTRAEADVLYIALCMTYDDFADILTEDDFSSLMGLRDRLYTFSHPVVSDDPDSYIV